MYPLFDKLRPVIRFAVRHAGVVFVSGVVLSGLAVLTASNLRIDTDLSKLVPSHYESVKALERLRVTVGAESDLAVGIASSSFDANVAFAEELIPRALGLMDPNTGEPFLYRVDYRRDTEFLERNALYLATDDELDTLQVFLEDAIEQAKLDANPFFFDLEDDEEGDADERKADRLKGLYDDVIGTEYPVSVDSTTLVLKFYPSGSQTNLDFIDRLYSAVRQLVDETAPTSFQADMKVTLAGRMLRQLVEVRAITKNISDTLGIGITIVLMTVVLYFMYKAYTARAGRTFSRRILLEELSRVPVMALLIGLPLTMSLTWTAAIAYLFFETLNLMTATLGLVLFGLGIDYGIHFYARYTEERAQAEPGAAAEITFVSTGQAVGVGALTTAAALYVLMFADFRGFSEFGFIAGTGILFALVSMLFVMPALIILLERWGILKLSREDAVPVREIPVGGRIRGARPIIAASLLAVVAAVVLFPPKFEYAMGELEPVYADFEQRQDVIRRVQHDGSRRNPAYILADSPDDVPEIVAAIRETAEADTTSPTILAIESLQDRFPMSDEKGRAKIRRIDEIRLLLDDPFLTLEFDEDLNRLRRATQTKEPVPLDSMPDFLARKFTSKSGEIGGFIAVYPSVGLSDGRNSIAFSKDIGKVVTAGGRTYYAGSTSLIAADMLQLMQRESPWIVGATLLVVIVLMRLNFGSWKWALLASVPLVVGVLWMVLVMELFDMRLNFYNLIVLPAVLGIGNDAGVHIVHRYQEEGVGSLRFVLKSTGEHVTMGSLTTMMGFAGPLLSFHPGLQSIGKLAVVGVGATLLSALLFLTALLQVLEDRHLTKTEDNPSHTGPAA